jgi:glycosyltransferase involved in cell wall biosynthesis
MTNAEHRLKNEFIIIMPVHNGEDSIALALESVLMQNFKNIGIIIRDDVSTDQTAAIINSMLGIGKAGICYKEIHGREILYIRNTEKLYGGGNTWHSAVNFVKNKHAIVGVVDGDDMLIDRNAVRKIYNIYRQKDMWLVWSQHQAKSLIGKRPAGYSSPLPDDTVIYTSRNYWAVSHFRTCKAWLFDLIRNEDILDPFYSSSFFRVAADAAILYPMIELCGNRKSYFLDEALYLYNDNIPTNEFKLYSNEVKKYTYFIREQQRRYLQVYEQFLPVRP